MSECEHLPGLAWQPAMNEDGWECYECKQELGFRPDLDRECTFDKVYSLLLELSGQKLVYVANGTMGEVIADNASARCRSEGRYDQQSILRYLLEDPNLAGHAEFWAAKARERCGVCGRYTWEPLADDCVRHAPDRLTPAFL